MKGPNKYYIENEFQFLLNSPQLFGSHTQFLRKCPLFTETDPLFY